MVRVLQGSLRVQRMVPETVHPGRGGPFRFSKVRLDWPSRQVLIAPTTLAIMTPGPYQSFCLRRDLSPFFCDGVLSSPLLVR